MRAGAGVGSGGSSDKPQALGPGAGGPARAIGEPSALSFVTLTTKAAFATDYPASAGGKTAVYMLRWVNTRGEKGPWSEVAAASVAAA